MLAQVLGHPHHRFQYPGSSRFEEFGSTTQKRNLCSDSFSLTVLVSCFFCCCSCRTSTSTHTHHLDMNTVLALSCPVCLTPAPLCLYSKRICISRCISFTQYTSPLHFTPTHLDSGSSSQAWIPCELEFRHKYGQISTTTGVNSTALWDTLIKFPSWCGIGHGGCSLRHIESDSMTSRHGHINVGHLCKHIYTYEARQQLQGILQHNR